MKRLLVIALAFSLILSLASCSEKQAEGEKAPVQMDVEILVSQGAGDEGGIYALADGELDNLSTALPDRFPVYVNEYAYGQEGPLYTMTEELKETVIHQLKGYLSLLYQDLDLDLAFDPGWEYGLSYTRGSTEVNAVINSISILSEEYDVGADVTDAQLLDNPLVNAGVRYLDLEAPQVTRWVEYTPEGTEVCRTYEIAEEAEDPLIQARNLCFAHITVRKYTDSGRVLVQIGSAGESLPCGEESGLSYAAVWELLKENSPAEEVQAQVYYSATVQPGYFVPCYRFYVKDGTEEGYARVEVRLVERKAE